MLVYDGGTIYKCTNVGSTNAAATWEELELGGNQYLPLTGGTLTGELCIQNNSLVVNDDVGYHVVNISNTGIELQNSDNDKLSISIDASNGEITAPTFKKLNGVSTEFLKADGSVDSNSYLKEADLEDCLSKSQGGTIKGPLEVTNNVTISSEFASIDTSDNFSVKVGQGDNTCYTTFGPNTVNIKTSKASRVAAIKMDPADKSISAGKFIVDKQKPNSFLMADGSVNDETYVQQTNFDSLQTQVNTLDSSVIKSIAFNDSPAILTNGAVTLNQVMADWDNSDAKSYSYIKNKPPFNYRETNSNVSITLGSDLSERICPTESTYCYKNTGTDAITITFPNNDQWINMSSSDYIYTVPAGKYAEFILTYWPASATGGKYLVTYNGAVQP